MTVEERDRIADALRTAFAAKVDTDEIVDRPGRYEFAMESPQFEGVGQLARQDLVWAVVDQVVPRSVTLDISLILTYAPSELAEA